MQRRASLAVLSALALVSAACSGGSDDAAPGADASVVTQAPNTEPPATDVLVEASPATDGALKTAEPSLMDRLPIVEPDFDVSSGVEQVAITGATPGSTVSIVTTTMADEDRPEGAVSEPASGGQIDAYGSFLFRNLDASTDWRLVVDDAGITDPIDVLARDEHPDPAFFAEQRLVPGLNYIEMRDGTTLSANVVLPGSIEDGPYPTVVEYSGYTPADPNGSGFNDLFVPLGYAYVGVNMRGTGCSGGSFRYFEYAQSADGYDAVEAVAAQPWVFENRVGMVGVSYPGISQLFVAQTQPPSLAAITPFSVIDDSYNSTLYPGGILNTGFAVEWTQDRVDNGKPAITPTGEIIEAGGQGWAKDAITAGDETCAANQSLRDQNPDLIEEIFDSPFVDSEDNTDDLSPRLFVDKITVPTFIAGAWQDEQTGGRFPTMLDRFTGTDKFYVSLMNGLHTESIGPANFTRWVEFLDLYVAKRTPTLDTARVIAPILASGLFGTGELALPDDRFTGMAYADALAVFEAEPSVRVLFEEGAADGTTARTPLPRFVEEFESWPIPSLEPTEWFFGVDGSLDSAAADTASQTEYLALPDGIPATFLAEESAGSSGDIWKLDVQWDWQQNAPGTAATFITEPLSETVTMAGSGSADLWVQSNLGDTDLEVTVSEVRPDGQEMYVQSGWLRASHRALDEAESSVLQPAHTHRAGDSEQLPDGEFAPVRVEIFPFAHVFRAGSQIRISVDAPGNNRPVWVFDTISGGEQVTIGLGGATASKVVLPVVPGINPPAAYPECGSLRGQPCRAFPG
ncbi:MAG: putative acyl esterase [Ilumatobacter sp.]|jgi:predicted acyl esterase